MAPFHLQEKIENILHRIVLDCVQALETYNQHSPTVLLRVGGISRKASKSQKSLNFFLGGLRPPRTPFKSAAVAASASQVRTLEPSRPLSRPPGVGSTWSMVWNVDYRTARSSPTRPADSGTFFWAPFRNFFLHVFFLSHFQENKK